MLELFFRMFSPEKNEHRVFKLDIKLEHLG